MIPKIIHYSWLSGEELTQQAKDCLASWKELMPDYEYVLWDQSRFDIHSLPWVEQACAARKWAYAADYIRMYALYNHGGIYLDLDVRAIKPLDPFLVHRGFSGIEWDENIYNDPDKHKKFTTGVAIEVAAIGAEKGHPMIEAFMEYYHGRNFVKENGKLDMTFMPVVATPIAKRFGFDDTNYTSHQILSGDFHVYPYDWFPGVNTPAKDPYFSRNSVIVHLHANSYQEGGRRLHHPATELKKHTRQYFANLKSDVFRRMFRKYNKTDYKKNGPHYY